MVVECLVPAAGMTFLDIFYCTAILIFGDLMFATLVFLIALSYVMWKAGIPMSVTLPISIVMLAVISGASYMTNPVFHNLLWLIILCVAVLFTLAILKIAR
jgi:hypothetical protein